MSSARLQIRRRVHPAAVTHLKAAMGRGEHLFIHQRHGWRRTHIGLDLRLPGAFPPQLGHALVAQQPDDIDVVLALGYGFPRWEGGPVFWARRQDLAVLQADLQQLAALSGHGFAVADLSPLLNVPA